MTAPLALDEYQRRALDRLLAMSEVTPDGCRLFTGCIQANGYGRFGYYIDGKRRTVYAHRAAYELTVGPIPGDLPIDHLCRVRHCIETAHLEPVTQAENTRRATRLITACPVGHPYDTDNTRYDRNGHRYCRECCRVKSNARYHAQRQAVSA